MRVASRKKLTLTLADLSKLAGGNVTSAFLLGAGGADNYPRKTFDEIHIWVEVEQPEAV